MQVRPNCEHGRRAVNKLKETKMNHTQQAEELAAKMNLKLSIKLVAYGKYFSGDKKERYIFTLRLQRGRKSYTFKFGQSIAAGAQEPTMYDVLVCLHKYEVGSFEDFCSEFGYNEDSRTAHRTYVAACKGYAAMQRLFTADELEQLQEIA